MQIIHKHLQ